MREAGRSHSTKFVPKASSLLRHCEPCDHRRQRLVRVPAIMASPVCSTASSILLCFRSKNLSLAIVCADMVVPSGNAFYDVTKFLVRLYFVMMFTGVSVTASLVSPE